MSIDDDDPEWNKFVASFRADAVSKIAESAFTISLVPGKDFDVKFATELGASIMLNKPIVPVVLPGREIPAGLERVAHAVIHLDQDVDTQAGRDELERKLSPILEEFK